MFALIQLKLAGQLCLLSRQYFNPSFCRDLRKHTRQNERLLLHFVVHKLKLLKLLSVVPNFYQSETYKVGRGN